MRAFTLVELLVAGAISTVVGLIVILALSNGVHIFRSNESEMWARENGSRTIRAMQDSVEKATGVHIYPNRAGIGGAETSYGSCVVLDLPDTGKSVAYYFEQTGPIPSVGYIYYDPNTATAPTPALDKVLMRTAMDLEVRRNPSGAVRIGFKLGTLGYPRRLYGSVEADRVRFTTSAVPRNL